MYGLWTTNKETGHKGWLVFNGRKIICQTQEAADLEIIRFATITQGAATFEAKEMDNSNAVIHLKTAF
jgi:hypothetical protein